MQKLVFLFCLVSTALGANSKIAPSLHRLLKNEHSANVFVSFDGTAAALDSIRQGEFESRGERMSTLRASLQANAAASQRNVLELLERSASTAHKSFWINNQVFIKGATFDLLHSIALISEVTAIAAEEQFEIYRPVEVLEESGAALNEEWGVSLIQAPEAWGLDGGNNGANVRVATIDTGVRGTHEALRANFHPKNGWFDPYQATPTPNDQNGHGTHVTGTIAGQGGIGVAPGATWLACKGCSSFFCEQNALIECGEFMICPTNPDGEDADCEQTPHLVSNSWGGGQGSPMFNEVIAAWKAGGIVALFANGNSGPSCGSANSPADHADVIAVGSTTAQDGLSSFSSVGPSVFGTIKPDVSGPGSSVRSSYHSADDAYSVLSGTSMASPHAAGVVALLIGRDLELSVEDVKVHLTSGIDRDVIQTGRDCGGVSEDTWPNNAFGFGRINALKALISLIQASS